MNGKYTKASVVKFLNFGKGVAKLEIQDISFYFYKTDQWKSVLDGTTDLIFWPKGSGKSAIFILIKANGLELEKRGILLAVAEKPSGNPVFQTLITNPPQDEAHFVAVWKIYSLALFVRASKDIVSTTTA